MLIVIAGIIAFYLIAFIVYAWSDYIKWKVSIHKWFIDNQAPIPPDPQEEDYYLEHRHNEISELYQRGDIELANQAENQLIHEKVKSTLEEQYRNQLNRVSFASKIRALFEFVLPIIIAIMAISFLLLTEISVISPDDSTDDDTKEIKIPTSHAPNKSFNPTLNLPR